jgi:hypothetical protein
MAGINELAVIHQKNSKSNSLMQSKIDITEFRKRLSKNTLIGNPNINGTPLVVLSLLYSSDHKFFGRINGNTFEITKHSTFSPIPYILKGKISSEIDSKTRVKYIIKPIWFGYLWIRIIPIIFALFVISGIISNHDLIFPLGIFGSIIMLMFIHNIYRIEHRKRNFEIDFKMMFEIT